MKATKVKGEIETMFKTDGFVYIRVPSKTDIQKLHLGECIIFQEDK